MSDDNGFVERPRLDPRARRDGTMARLRATATNGKAIARDRYLSGAYSSLLRGEGLCVHQKRNPDGTYIAWCERIPSPPQARPRWR